jgi:hypothetical protein
MQAIIALPNGDNWRGSLSLRSALLRPVCGVPLIARVVATAERSGADEVLLIGSPDDAAKIKDICSRCLKSLSPDFMKFVPNDNCDFDSSASWIELSDQLQNELLWIPWNWVTNAHFLCDLPLLKGRPRTWSLPERLLRSKLVRDESDLAPAP